MTELVVGRLVRDLRARRRSITDEWSVVWLARPTLLLTPELASLRTAIVGVSDAAFERSTANRWEAKFTEGFLGPLARFFLLVDADDRLVGWSGYRAATIRRSRVVYFTSTGLLPRCQGAGLIPWLQRWTVAREARRHPLRPVVTAVRTRNPHSYRLAERTFGAPVVPSLDAWVAPEHRRLVAGIGAWLGFDGLDCETAIVRDTYGDEALYGQEPRSGSAPVDELFDRLGPGDALLVMGRRRWWRALRAASRDPV